MSGRHGDAVASTDKDGKSIIKLYTPPSKSSTEAQIAHRAKFGYVSKTLSTHHRLFKNTFGNNGVNKAVAFAMKNAVTGNHPDYEIDYTKLALTDGTLPTASKLTAEINSGTTVNVTWDNHIFLEDNPTDKANVVFMDSVTKKSMLIAGDATRVDGIMQADLSDVWVGNAIHCWFYFIDPANGNKSTSQYVSTLQL
jgi:hypothetical protein